MKKIAFIVNPGSGTGSKSTIVAYVHDVFGHNPNYSMELFKMSQPGDAPEAAADFAKRGFDIVAAIGGDGTVNSVAKGLIHSNSKMAIIPVGSGNGLARHLKIPLDYHKAVDVILSGKSVAADAGKINEQPFFCTAGLGFEAVIGNAFNSGKDRGLISYVNFCAKEYLRYRPENYIIQIGGNTYRTRAFLITFANAAQWGNNAFIAPDASISDGLLDIVVWKSAPVATVPFLAAELFMGTLIHSNLVEMYRTADLHIIRERQGLIQFDGESRMMGADISVSVIKHAVHIIVP
jgi:diacylglycerol kinase (ATP)